MEIKSEIPFPKELQDLLEDKIFKRQLQYVQMILELFEIKKLILRFCPTTKLTSI